MEGGHSHPVSDVEMDQSHGFDVPISSFADTVSGRGKRKAGDADLGEDMRPVKPRTLGGDRQREVAVPRIIGVTGTNTTASVRMQPGVDLIPPPILVTYLYAKVEGTAEDILEATNSENLGT
jgi:protein HIRA/HIR1